MSELYAGKDEHMHDGGLLFGAFSKIVKDVIGNEGEDILKNVPQVPCPDQSVGIVSGMSKGVHALCGASFKRCRIDYSACPQDGKIRRVVIILESPHKDEFCMQGRNWKSIGPACGCTGCLLARNWKAVFGNRLDDCELVLANVVQYQCSLASAGQYKKYKNRILRRCMGNDVFKRYFKTRIEWLGGRNCVFVNACTGGVSQSSAHSKVTEWLKELSVNPLELTHPSSWTYPKIVNEQHVKAEAFFRNAYDAG